MNELPTIEYTPLNKTYPPLFFFLTKVFIHFLAEAQVQEKSKNQCSLYHSTYVFVATLGKHLFYE